ncbi:hypothetical protein NLI96_g13136 [Meripilus lineatus]|uniref:Uncharacterized protein n=1 Tax=Meripilus lineatus TaxID=2056292 RepID=A0AAD5YBR9_9APHY|nr:hypothetical protein NLI96_g13136 [Physisporinus lineatus]
MPASCKSNNTVFGLTAFLHKRSMIVQVRLKYARVVQVVGIGFTAYDLKEATDQSIKAKSIRPIEKEVVRQIGGWGGAIAGAKMGTAAGALVGIETGPGAIITGLIGGIIFGAVGYMGGSAVANQIPNN